MSLGLAPCRADVASINSSPAAWGLDKPEQMRCGLAPLNQGAHTREAGVYVLGAIIGVLVMTGAYAYAYARWGWAT